MIDYISITEEEEANDPFPPKVLLQEAQLFCDGDKKSLQIRLVRDSSILFNAIIENPRILIVSDKICEYEGLLTTVNTHGSQINEYYSVNTLTEDNPPQEIVFQHKPVKIRQTRKNTTLISDN